MNNSIIAIDPGKGGGIATFINNEIKAYSMPEKIKEVFLLISHIKEKEPGTILFIEKVQTFQDDSKEGGKNFGINKMLHNYAQLIAVAEIVDIPFIEVYPRSWQSKLQLKIERPKGINNGQFKTLRKRKYKSYAQQCFPELKVNLKTSDCLCLIQFALLKYSNEMKWIEKYTKNKKELSLF